MGNILAKNLVGIDKLLIFVRDQRDRAERLSPLRPLLFAHEIIGADFVA